MLKNLSFKISMVFITILVIIAGIKHKSIIKVVYFESDCQSNINEILIKEINEDCHPE